MSDESCEFDIQGIIEAVTNESVEETNEVAANHFELNIGSSGMNMIAFD